MNFTEIINKHTKINESFDDMNNRRLEREDISVLLNQIQEYGRHSNIIYGDDRMYEIINQLGPMIDNIEVLTLQEQDDWMDKVSVSRDMKSLKESYKLMQKTAMELRPLRERLNNCYDSIGMIIDKYYVVGDEK